MEPNYAACLELSIAMPGFFSSPSSFPASGESGGGDAIKELDINQAPYSGREELEDQFMEEEDDDASPAAVRRKKLRLSKQQSRLLEESFVLNHNLNPKEKEALAMELKLKPRQVEVWFQNRRARNKMKQTEMECEYLKKWFATLTEQNRRLQKEVAELRAMKLAPASPICLHPQPPAATQLTMCPRCECVTTAALLEKGPAAARC